MTAMLERPPAPVPTKAPARADRRGWLIAVLLLLAWSIVRATPDSDLINTGGWGQVREFFGAMFHPRLDNPFTEGSFVQLTIRETFVTLGYALLGSALAILIGIVGGFLVSQRTWQPLAGPPRPAAQFGWQASRFLFAVPRSVHEVIFGLILVNILGIDPMVAVLAIGIPFGAVTAKVFAELMDEVPGDAARAMRAGGAGRLTALAFGVVPTAIGDLLSYSFYRLECGIRSAAVLGFVGAGGLGFQIALSFQSLRYDEMWTFLWALIIVSGLADWWSSTVRRRHSQGAIQPDAEADMEGVVHNPKRDPFLRWSAAFTLLLIPIAWWRLGLEISTLWSQRTRTLSRELVEDAWPPKLGAGGWTDLWSDALDTIALAVLAIAMAWTFASVIAFVAARRTAGPLGVRALGVVARFLLLVARSVPPPVWALLAVFTFKPGLWPGAIALGLYQLGVLGRLEGEVVENQDDRPGRALRASGATATTAAAYATVPAVATRFVALGLYRWEVTIRDTVIVGVAGAAGLGRRIAEQAAAFDYQGILASVLALIAVTLVVDVISATLRRTLR